MNKIFGVINCTDYGGAKIAGKRSLSASLFRMEFRDGSSRKSKVTGVIGGPITQPEGRPSVVIIKPHTLLKMKF